MRPILLTGASGYLGAHVLARLRARQAPVAPTSSSGRVGERCDLTDAHATSALLRQVAPSVVVHCAARVPKSGSDYSDGQAAECSIAMVSSLAQHAQCPLVLISSMTVYPEDCALPATEEATPMPAGGYAHGKWVAERIVFERRRHGDVALRLPGLFGPPRRSGLLYNAARAFVTRGTFEMAGPEVLWAAMTVEDAAEYVARAATATALHPPEPVNVGYAGTFSVRAAVEQIATICGVDWQPRSGSTKPFAARLERLEARYGLLNVTFAQRLTELVQAVRAELAAGELRGAHAP